VQRALNVAEMSMTYFSEQNNNVLDNFLTSASFDLVAMDIKSASMKSSSLLFRGINDTGEAGNIARETLPR